MKYIKFYKTSILILLLSIVSCSRDILDRFPEDAVSDETFFRQASDFEIFANGLYGSVIRNVAQAAVFLTLERDSDNIIDQLPFTGIQLRNESGVADQTSRCLE